MIHAIAGFELRYQLRQPLLWLMLGAFLLIGFASGSSEGLGMGRAIGAVDHNAPFTTALSLNLISLLGLLLTPVFVAGAILRDFDCRTYELVFSRPVRRRDYFLGRFLGAFLICVTVFLGAVVGHLLGGLAPWIDPERLGPFTVLPYLWALAVLVVPNLFFCAAVFFSLASLTRSMLATYLGVVGFFAAYALSRVLFKELASRTVAAFVDPFGLGALREATQYWTIVEHNTILPTVGGVVLHNRLVWLGVAVAVLALAWRRFRFAPPGTAERPSTGAPGEDASVAPAAPALRLPRRVPSFNLATAARQLGCQLRLEVTAVVKSVVFRVLLAFAVVLLVLFSYVVDRRFGTPVYPVTHLMVYLIATSFALPLIIIVTFYGGELIWRERAVKLAEMFDAMPVPNGVYLGAKLGAQLLVVVAFLAISLVTTIAIQSYHGYYAFELAVYAKGLVVTALPFLLFSVLASFLQVASGSKFVGYLLMVLYLLSDVGLDALHLNHYLYQYAETPAAPYSDMNGYGHFVAPLVWFNVYWAFAAAILTVLMLVLWPRGTDPGPRARLRLAAARLRGPVRLALAVAVAGFLATGAWIFYNTNVLNEYLSHDRTEARQADYEKKYRQYKDADLPRITDVAVDVDLYPAARRLEARGRYLCVNRNPAPLAEIHLSLPPRVTVNALDLPPHTVLLDDAEHGYRILRLDRPLLPGEEMELRFDLTVRRRGFVNHDPDNRLVGNGTFIDSGLYFPTFGYDADRQLADPNARRRHDLPPVHRLAPVDDLEARRRTYVGDADWIRFATTVSTRADQIAIAPGHLEREWTAGDRRYFHYRVDGPMLKRYAYVSGNYVVVRDRWHEVAIEVYYHTPHAYNVERMIDAVKKSLAYYSENFGPFQHRQLRIVEFPRYARFAQALPGMVPFSESIGFIARVEGEDAIDYPFYVTAHEVAHQWWIHQVVGGYVQGWTMLSETMSQYSALMVMEQEYGPEKMRRFLKYELDEYLRNRSTELAEEMPLYLVENQQYLHYHKGSVVMYALRDYLGEALLNQVLARYVADFRFQEPPYTNTVEFLDYVRPVVPAGQEGLLRDLFETITLYENRVEEATFARRADGKYEVAVRFRARKVRADGQGLTTDLPLDDWIDVGVFGERRVDGKREETVLFLEKRHVTAPDGTFEVVVDERPVRAGIDPFNKLIDRDSDDNVRRVTAAAPTGIAGGVAGS